MKPQYFGQLSDVNGEIVGWQPLTLVDPYPDRQPHSMLVGGHDLTFEFGYTVRLANNPLVIVSMSPHRDTKLRYDSGCRLTARGMGPYHAGGKLTIAAPDIIINLADPLPS